jgi:hypothetical protein
VRLDERARGVRQLDSSAVDRDQPERPYQDWSWFESQLRDAGVGAQAPGVAHRARLGIRPGARGYEGAPQCSILTPKSRTTSARSAPFSARSCWRLMRTTGWQRKASRWSRSIASRTGLCGTCSQASCVGRSTSTS